MQLTGKRIFSAVMLVGTVITVYQVMSKPQPVAQPVLVSVAQESARAFDEKLQQLQTPRPAGNAPAEVHFTSDEVSAEMAQSAGVLPAPQARPVSSIPNSPDTVVAPGEVAVHGYQVK